MVKCLLSRCFSTLYYNKIFADCIVSHKNSNKLKVNSNILIEKGEYSVYNVTIRIVPLPYNRNDYGEKYMQNMKLKKHKERIIRTRREKICHEVVFVLFIIYAFTLLYPFLFLLINLLKVSTEEIQAFPLWLPLDTAGRSQRPPKPWAELPTLWNPLKWNWKSYQTALNHKDVAIVSMFANTIKLAIGETFVAMTLIRMAAYGLVKYPFKGNSFIYTFVVDFL